MTTIIGANQFIYGAGAPTALAPNNTWYINTTNNALYVSQSNGWIQVSGGGSGAIGANPSAVGSDVAVNGVAPTFLRSDGAFPIQKGTNAQFGIVEVDGVTITSAAGVISSVGGATGANPTATAGPVAVNGSALTFMRSDGASAIQKATNAQFGLAEGDGVTITAVVGVLSAITTSGGVASYTEANWTATDLSGAGLVLTTTRATYTQMGRMIFVDFDIHFPVTANGSLVSIGGFPNMPATVDTLFLVQATASPFLMIGEAVITPSFSLTSLALASITNANMSNARIQGCFTYPAT